ncbi:MAG: iron-containing alcohol dehydrogenase, partial [Mycobacterium sp.]|nr:iron-containing alcohol dehydrogenase [Mycobacterium sp.]
MLRVFCSPARYTQGPNATASLGAEMAVLGLDGPALVVAGRSASRLLSDVWDRSFAGAAITYRLHEFGGQCSQQEIDRIKDAALRGHARVIIGAGGGKVLDAARAAAAD